MTQRCKKRLVEKYNTRSLHILRDHVRCAPAPRYNCPHLHFYFMLFCAPASHFTHPHLFYPTFPHPRSRRKVPNSAVWEMGTNMAGYKSRIRNCKGPITWKTFNPEVELSPVNRVEIFLRLHGRFQPRG